MTYDRNVISGAGKAAASLDAVTAAGERQGFFRRLIAAMQESRQRHADIEIRRIRALMADDTSACKHSLLPFQGE
jgi:hypothetical protein